MDFLTYLSLLLIAIFTGFTYYNLRKIRILIEEMKNKMEGNSEAKEDLPSIQGQLSSIQKQLSGKEGGLITAIEYQLGHKGAIYKQLTQRLAKKKAEELLVELENHEASIKTSKGWVPIGILVRKLWSENKAFSSYEWKGIIEDWWKEVDDLEWRLEEVKRQEAVDKFKKSGRTKISYEAKTFDDSDVIKEITIWLEGPLGVGTYWDFQKTLQEIGCPEEKIPKEDFMAKNSGRTLNIEW